MKKDNLVLSGFVLSIMLLFLVSAGCSNQKKLRQMQMQTIIEANRKALNNGEPIFDSVHIKKDTIFYYRNNEFQGSTIITID